MRFPILVCFLPLPVLLACGGGDAEEPTPQVAAEAPGTIPEGPAEVESTPGREGELPPPERTAVPRETLSPPPVPSPQERVGEAGDGAEELPPTVRTDSAPPPPLEPALRPELIAPVVPAGTVLTLELEEELSSRSSREGDSFYARVAEEVLAGDGMILIPEGSRARGRVVQSASSTSSQEEAVLAIQLETLLLEGVERQLTATVLDAELVTAAGESGARTAATIATGAAAGTAVEVSNREGHAVLAARSRIRIRLDEALLLP